LRAGIASPLPLVPGLIRCPIYSSPESADCKISHPMPRYDFRSPRVYVDSALGPSTSVVLDAAQAHYLRDVLRLRSSDAVLVFNGRAGEWRARIASAGERKLVLAPMGQTRQSTTRPAPHHLFAPLT